MDDAEKARRSEAFALFTPEARDWLPLEIEYKGIGEAVFETNPGTLRGPVTIRFGEDGSLEEFSMLVEDAQMETEPAGGKHLGMHAYVNGLPLGENAFIMAGTPNRCVAVRVEGDGFVVEVAQDEVIAMGHMAEPRVDFTPFRTVVTFNESAVPRYWATPLVNFTSNFFTATTALHEHPLRVRRTGPFDPDGDNHVLADHLYQQGNWLIPFLEKGEMGFIEPLVDYKDRANLVEDTGENTITAVMVGPTGSDSHPTSRDEWFPADLMPLLSLVTGRGVCAPWVELRDADAGIIGRLHTSFGKATTRKGVRLIDEGFNRSTGALITAFLDSDHGEAVYMRVAIKHLVRALSKDIGFEDQLSHLFRAAEGLSIGLGLDEPRPLEASEHVRLAVENSLDGCIDELEDIARSVTGPDRDRVFQLRSLVMSVRANRPSFRTQLLALLAFAKLPDAEWLASFKFRARQEDKLVSWSRAASDYRNRVFHAAFIEFTEEYHAENAFMFTRHLSDVLVRVVFQLLGFQGHYEPICGWQRMGAHHELVAWPENKELTGLALGYVD